MDESATVGPVSQPADPTLVNEESTKDYSVGII
jgi:hypothetical protein